jgi:hypothetical protein
MTPQLKFLRRVRIHGRECGAVARALHHEAEIISLPAVNENVSFTTNERKQMSTKTTLKRIALVAVSALGLSFFSVMPAANAYANNITLGYSSLTVVDTSNTPGSTKNGFFYVDLTDEDGDPVALGASESITVSVTGTPTSPRSGVSTAITDLDFQAVYSDDPEGTAFTAAGGLGDGTQQVPNGTTASALFASDNNTYDATAADSDVNARYWFAVSGNAAAYDSGEYTVTVRLITSTGGTSATQFIVAKTLKVKFVTNAEDSGAVITVAKTGDIYTGEALYFNASQQVSATLRDANGGRVQNAAAATGTIGKPTLLAQLITSLGAVAETLDTPADTGVTGTDYVESTTAAVAAVQAAANGGDGVYGVTHAAITAAASTTAHTLRVRLLGTSKEGSVSIFVRANPAIIDNLTDLTLVASGIVEADTFLKANVATTTAYTLPTTAKTAKLIINVDSSGDDNVANVDVTTKVTWSGNYATASVSPATTTTTTTKSDASGNVELNITNNAPVAGAVATVLVTGYGFSAGVGSDPSGTGSRTITLTWAAPIATTISVIDPVASVRVKTATTNVLTVSVKDQFGALMSGESLQPSLSSTSSNYSATTTYAAITTGATGTATFSLTDAAAVAGSDVVSFASVSNSAATAGSFTLTYVTTLPVVANMTLYFDHDFDATSPANLVPSTGITAGTAGTGASLILENARNQSKTLASFVDAATDDMVKIRIASTTSAGAAATGAAVTVTAGDGGHVLSAAGLPASSRTIAVSSTTYSDFQIMATKPGTITFTITSGTVSKTLSLIVAVPTVAKARTVAISGAATGTSNGDAVPMTVTVKDRFGNGVTGVVVNLSATNGGSYAGGATTQSYTTDDTGTFTVSGTSFVEAGATAKFTASISTSSAVDAASSLGYVGSTEVDSTLAAGVSTASATVTFAAGPNKAQAAAEAATDAAAEAIDAANAATDAANLAAEAADAATVAAEEARDAADAATAAVEELATQVATLMAALKAQITTLANTVAKIAKKVKA